MTFAACSTGAALTALVRFCVALLVVFVMKQSIPAERLLDNSIIPLHLAAFLPAETSAAWRSAASKVDLFQLVFVVGLIAYLVDEEGFARDTRKIIWVTAGCYAAWIVLGMVWAAAWSGFAG
jgi:fluoride ion exporter CrcB/FEX